MYKNVNIKFFSVIFSFPFLSSKFTRQATLEPTNINICRIKMSDYEQHHYDKESLKQSAALLGSIEVNPSSDLEAVRVLINKMSEECSDSSKLTPDWCFIDCKHLIKTRLFLLHKFFLSLYRRTMFSC